MVTVLLMTIFLAMVSVCLWLYSRTLLTSATAQVARHVANADIPASAAADRVTELLGRGIAGSTASTLVCVNEPDPDAVLVGVRCTMAAPGLLALLDGVLPDISVTGHAVAENLP